MSVGDPMSSELREALRMLRNEPAGFEQAVRDRIQAGEKAAAESVGTTSPLLRIAASIIPLPILGGKTLLTSAKVTPVGAGYKALGYIALPAISIFLMLGAFIFTALNIRRTRGHVAADQEAAYDAMRSWWRRRWWIAATIYFGVFVALYAGSGDVVFVFLLCSFVALAVLLRALSRASVATRSAIADACSVGLLILCMLLSWGMPGSEVGVVDPSITAGVLLLGAILLVYAGGAVANGPSRRGRVVAMVAIGVLMLPTLVWPATEWGMRRYVEGLDEAKHGSATWHKWEVPATWLNANKREVDWRAPRALFVTEELGGKQNCYVLGVAMRVGLLRAEDFAGLRSLEGERDSILKPEHRGVPFNYVDQEDWLIRVLAAQGALHATGRDLLATRLRATWDQLHDEPAGRVELALVIARLRDVIERPGDLVAQRDDAHAWLRFASQAAGDFFLQPAGGFSDGEGEGGVTDGKATWAAVHLMERYGVPEGLDLRAVRSSVRPQGSFILGPDWIAAATRWKMDSLWGFGSPSLLEFVAYERTFIASILLVLLAMYATLRAPRAEDLSLHAEGPIETPASEDT